jgi:hypothetical protein
MSERSACQPSIFKMALKTNSLLVHRDETKPVILLLLLLLLFHVSDKEKENKPSRNHEEADKENYTTAVFLVSLSVFYMD